MTTSAEPSAADIRPGRRSDLQLRALSAAILAPIALAATIIGGWAASLVAALASIVVLVEWLSVTGRYHSRLRAVLCATVVAAGVLSVGSADIGIGLAIQLAGALLALAVTRDLWVPAGMIYAGALGTSLLLLRLDPAHGIAATITIFLIVWATDIGAYGFGRAIGGPKLWPRISPNKTWSGVVGGLMAGTLFGVFSVSTTNIVPGLTFGIVAFALSLISQIGDLVESAIKRRFGIKDASKLIPGHGGVMDRVDGLIFAGSAAALIGYLHEGAGHIGRGFLVW